MVNKASTIGINQLKESEALKEVPNEQLQWFIDNSIYRTFKDGDLVFKVGDPIAHTNVLLKGKMRILGNQNGRHREIGQINCGDVTGYLPFSRIKEAGGDVQCTEDSAILSCPSEKIKAIAGTYYELTEALVHIMTTRVREYTAIQQQNEKMISLGKLSAGLTHELNNPAAAIARSAVSLQHHDKESLAAIKELALIGLTEAQADNVIATMATLMERNKPQLSMMQQSALEDEIMDWFDENEIDDNNNTEVLTDGGITVNDLNNLNTLASNKRQLTAILNWLACLMDTREIVGDIHESAKRISNLVDAVKNFTYMDQDANRQYIDIHPGITNTLAILQYKIRKMNITVYKDFDHSLPKIEVLPGELNQVWTNIIDNAVDAMQKNGAGQLRISTKRDHQFVRVEITDNGTGIPEDIRNKVFDPFFTTKQIGKGTGLGLDVVMQVIRRHNGSVKVTSQPGNTTFIVCFPITND